MVADSLMGSGESCQGIQVFGLADFADEMRKEVAQAHAGKIETGIGVFGVSQVGGDGEGYGAGAGSVGINFAAGIVAGSGELGSTVGR